ncbi:hypothetical protein MMC12_001057 [Toensbergia leucococca]|nr:hypothetical protein [Toensbergia leucococca]
MDFDDGTHCHFWPYETIEEETPEIYQSIGGVSILTTCSQINAEGGLVLYGKNTFSFNSGQCIYRHYEDVKPEPCLPCTIPRKKIKDISRIFKKNWFQPEWIWLDPFFRFFKTIGQSNAEKIRQIKISGERGKDPSAWATVGSPSIGQVLEIYCVFMDKFLKDLDKLTIDTDHDGKPIYSHIFKRVVEKMPNLKRLEATSRSAEKKQQAEFWCRFVKSRAEEREAKALRTLRQQATNGRESSDKTQMSANGDSNQNESASAQDKETNGPKKGKRWRYLVECHYCHKKGHKVSQCWKMRELFWPERNDDARSGKFWTDWRGDRDRDPGCRWL